MALGLSLAEVARRAGTSAPTVSRYEHNWSRFEIKTLQKLAIALDADLSVELHPKANETNQAFDEQDAIRALSRLFWEHPLSLADFQKHSGWIVERVLEYGQLEDIKRVRRLLGKKQFLKPSPPRVSHRIRQKSFGNIF
jgi:transcriptional regulator with XRE-family HTH domain